MDDTEKQPDTQEECLSGALELAEAKYARFVNKSRRDRDQLLDGLPPRQRFGGRAHSLQDAFLKTTERRIRKWATIYKRVASEQRCSSLISKPEIESLRKRMLASTKAAEDALVDRVLQDAAAAGDANQLVVHAWEKNIRRTFQPTLLDVINSELSVLEAKGRVAGQPERRSVQASYLEQNQSIKTSRARSKGNGAKVDRRAWVDTYIEEVFKKTGKRITRTAIWKKAGDKSRAEFERWESFWYEKRNRKPNQAANQRFTQILIEKPHLT